MTKQDLKIVFMGNPDFAVESLRRIVDDGYRVVGVVTMPDKTGGRGNKVITSPVKQYALERGLRILQPESLKAPEFLEELKSLEADLFIVIAFRMLPRQVWQMPPLGTFNLHASLLPRYRGAAPLNWAVINGDKQTGVTTFFLKHEIDTGDIIDRVAIDIADDDNVGTVHDRLMMLGADLTVNTIRHIIDGDLHTTPQDDCDEQPTPAPKIFKDTCRIDWRRPARDIHNLVRGLSPYPGAWSPLQVGADNPFDVKIFRTEVTGEPSTTPGQVTITADHRMLVDTATSRIAILDIQAPGKRRMPIADYLRGIRWDQAHFLNNPEQ